MITLTALYFMNIFIINSGSSSIKYQLFTMPSAKPICVGLIERIGEQNASIKHKTFVDDKEEVFEKTMLLTNHEEGLQQIVSLLTDKKIGVIKNTNDINVVGHRVVHGGELYLSATIINNTVKENIKALFSLAPLHNPANFTGIEVAEKIFREAKQVAVFDTAFHQTIPQFAFRYAIPEKFYKEDKIRVYGFHGTSHKYITEQARLYLNNNAAKLISIHLGNGCSMAAVMNGKCVDTSMGFSPLAGLVMGARSGDIDPSVLFYLMDKGYSSNNINNLLNKQSGMLGLTGSNDMRDVNKAVEEGDENAKLAVKMYAYRIQKYIGAYAAAMNGLDAIIFTAGVGENDAAMRKRVCLHLSFLNINIDDKKNEEKSIVLREINPANALIKVLVIPTNEELEIAKQCFELLH